MGLHLGFFNRINGGNDLFYGVALRYLHDSLGNLVFRGDDIRNYNDKFEYDKLNRLTRHKTAAVGGTGYATASEVTYDSIGNITFKPVVTSNPSQYIYTSGRPHAVTAISSYGVMDYDANGNMLSDSSNGGRNYTWTSFNQLKKATKGGGIYSRFAFDAAHQRVVQQSNASTTHYVGALYENLTSGTGANQVREQKFYIYAPTGRVAVRTAMPDQGKIETHYLHPDHLGSVVAVSSETGSIVQRFQYDPWGKKTVSLFKDSGSGKVTRGFTDHEQLDDLGLIHMNGRVYDPVTGRFLSADPFVQSPGDSQSYNRYSYCMNNPVSGTDPSGYFNLSLKTVLVIVAVVVVSVVTYGAASGAMYAAGTAATATTAGTATGVLAGSVAAGTISATTAGVIAGAVGGAAAGFASGFAGSLLNGGSIGDAFRAGAIGGAIGGITGGVGQYLSGFEGANPYVARFSAGALRGGIETGDFEGAVRGGLVNLAPTDLGVGDAYKNSMAVNFVVNTVRNAGQGYAINGKVGVERSVIGGWANSAVGHGLGLISSGGEGPTFKDGMYFYASKSSAGHWLTKHCYDAITFGNVVNTKQEVIDAGYGSSRYPGSYSYSGNDYARSDNPNRLNWTYAHEIDHYQTQDILGSYYIPLHAISQGMGTATGSNSGYYLEQWPFKLLPYGN